MNSQIVKSTTGKFYVEGQGFVGSNASATRLSNEDAACVAKCALKMGFGSVSVVEVPNSSFAVVYIRKGDGVSATGITKNPAQPGLNQFDPSPRRFATRAEANTHGKRFDTRRADRSDPKNSGTAGHVGFYVIETQDPVNSTVNPVSGLTNSIK